jgi:Ca2+-binding RTX toxin-like protein
VDPDQVHCDHGIDAQDGEDTVLGGAGNDVILGGAQSDHLQDNDRTRIILVWTLVDIMAAGYVFWSYQNRQPRAAEVVAIALLASAQSDHPEALASDLADILVSEHPEIRGGLLTVGDDAVVALRYGNICSYVLLGSDGRADVIGHLRQKPETSNAADCPMEVANLPEAVEAGR